MPQSEDERPDDRDAPISEGADRNFRAADKVLRNAGSSELLGRLGEMFVKDGFREAAKHYGHHDPDVGRPGEYLRLNAERNATAKKYLDLRGSYVEAGYQKLPADPAKRSDQKKLAAATKLHKEMERYHRRVEQLGERMKELGGNLPAPPGVEGLPKPPGSGGPGKPGPGRTVKLERPKHHGDGGSRDKQ